MIWKARKGPACRNLSGTPQEVKIRLCYIASSLSHRENPSLVNPSSSVHLLKPCDCVSPSGGGAQLPSLLSFSTHHTIIGPRNLGLHGTFFGLHLWSSSMENKRELQRLFMAFSYSKETFPDSLSTCLALHCGPGGNHRTDGNHMQPQMRPHLYWMGEWMENGVMVKIPFFSGQMCHVWTSSTDKNRSAFWSPCTWKTDWKENGEKGLHS